MGLDAALSHKHLYTGYTTTEKKHASTHARTRESKIYKEVGKEVYDSRSRSLPVLRVETRSRIDQGTWRQFLRTVRFWVSFISTLSLQFPSLAPSVRKETKESFS